MNAEEMELEAVPGLPGELPPGEQILWQGRPSWKALARHAFKIRWLAVYFGVFVVARLVSAAMGGSGPQTAAQVAVMLVLFSVCLGVWALVAWIQAKTTYYTITTHRVVMRIGAALPMTWNLPFSRIASAELTVRDAGDGDVILRLTPPNRMAWLHLWPHARPAARFKASPAFRAIAEPKHVAAVLEEAVRSWSEQESGAGVFVDTSIGNGAQDSRCAQPMSVPSLAAGANH